MLANRCAVPEIDRILSRKQLGQQFVTDLIRDMLISQTQRRNTITPEMKVITTLRYLANGKIQ